MYYLVKIIVTAILVVAISEAAKRWTFMSAVLASLPITSLLAIIWLYLETGDRQRIADFSLSVFWVVIPSLVFFISLFLLLKASHWNFWVSLSAATLLTSVSYFGYIHLLSKLRIL